MHIPFDMPLILILLIKLLPLQYTNNFLFKTSELLVEANGFKFKEIRF